jgi:hypothetical protein
MPTSFDLPGGGKFYPTNLPSGEPSAVASPPPQTVSPADVAVFEQEAFDAADARGIRRENIQFVNG